jgi:hypothetical protein
MVGDDGGRCHVGPLVSPSVDIPVLGCPPGRRRRAAPLVSSSSQLLVVAPVSGCPSGRYLKFLWFVGFIVGFLGFVFCCRRSVFSYLSTAMSRENRRRPCFRRRPHLFGEVSICFLLCISLKYFCVWSVLLTVACVFMI